jgi:MtN3 and saliva related transmembrane protein
MLDLNAPNNASASYNPPHMSEHFILGVGVVAGFLTTMSWVPQAIKTVRSRSARDFSWGYLLLFTLGVAGWTLYGLERKDPAVIGANAVTLVLLVPVHVVKLLEKKPVV